LYPWPHAFSALHGKRLILRRSVIAAPDPGRPLLMSATVLPGTVVEADGDRLMIATGDGPLRILEIQSEGKRPLQAREFLAGHHLKAGDRFTGEVR
jgi:methionyl-tRNA formyltransferase